MRLLFALLSGVFAARVKFQVGEEIDASQNHTRSCHPFGGKTYKLFVYEANLQRWMSFDGSDDWIFARGQQENQAMPVKFHAATDKGCNIYRLENGCDGKHGKYISFTDSGKYLRAYYDWDDAMPIRFKSVGYGRYKMENKWSGGWWISYTTDNVQWSKHGAHNRGSIKANYYEGDALKVTLHEQKSPPQQAANGKITTVVGKWHPMHGNFDGMKYTLKHGASKSQTATKSSSWSASVTAKVEAGMKIKGTGEVKTSLETTLSREMSQAFSEEWSSNEETQFEVAFRDGQVWQWRFQIETQGQETVVAKTMSYAVTEGQWEPPRCLPGYATDLPKYQECYDERHTIANP